MRKNAEKVLMAFAEGKKANGKTISTDGKKLFSYQLQIAQKNERDGIDILEYHAHLSATTKSHIRACVNFFATGSIDSRVESFE